MSVLGRREQGMLSIPKGVPESPTTLTGGRRGKSNTHTSTHTQTHIVPNVHYAAYKLLLP